LLSLEKYDNLVVAEILLKNISRLIEEEDNRKIITLITEEDNRKIISCQILPYLLGDNRG